jgi:hypothetical protein
VASLSLQDEFLNRIMTSDNSIQEAFTIHGLKALHNSLYKFYSHTFPKDFHVEILLRTWQEFDTNYVCSSYYSVVFYAVIGTQKPQINGVGGWYWWLVYR